jgi:flagellar protein FliJ
MKAFRFSLQALKTLRQQQENVALEQYAAAMRARQQAEDRLLLAQQEQQQAWAQWQNQLNTGCPAGELVASQDYARLLEIRRQECQAALHTAQESLRLAWERLLLARQKREAVDKFYARQRERYARECQRQEQKALDEMAHRGSSPEATAKLTPDFFWN